MSPLGHNITAFTLATTYLQISGVTWVQGFLSLPKMITDTVTGVDHFTFATLVALGMLVGARAPDRLEMPRFDRRTQTRRSLIPHRTLTHWPVLWVGLTGLSWWLWSQPQGLLIYAVTSVGLGFCASAWLHLAMDIMTPTGIPLRSPFGSRTSLNFYRTSMAGCRMTGELVCVFVFVIGCQLISKIIA
jgi:hypothetical protein